MPLEDAKQDILFMTVFWRGLLTTHKLFMSFFLFLNANIQGCLKGHKCYTLPLIPLWAILGKEYPTPGTEPLLSEFCPTAWSSFFSLRDSLGQSEGRPNTCLQDPPFCHLYQQLLADQNQRPAAAIGASGTISCGVDELKAESGDEF